eukprot:g8421.t1
MDRRNSGGGGDYGSGDGGRVGGNRSSYDRPEQGDGGGGRWQNDMYDSNAQQPLRNHGGGGGGYREKGGYQHDQRDHRADGGRGRGRGYGGGGGGDRYGGGRRDNRGGGGYRDQNLNNFGGQQDWPTPSAASGGSGNAGGGDAGQGEGGGGGGGGGGGERWQKHAQAMSARSGGDGYYAQRHGQQNQRPEISGEREQGRVCSLKESFGFVRCMDRRGDLFFHLTEAPPNINIGDEVDFFIGMGNRSGKDCALKLNVLPPGTVSSEVILDASFLGVIERDVRAYPSSMPSTHRANMMGRSRPHEIQQAEGLIKITGAAPAEDTPAETEGAMAQEGGDRTGVQNDAEASPETETTSAGGDGGDGTAAADTASETEEAVAGQSTQPAPVEDPKGSTTAPLGLQGAMVSYLVTDALEADAGSRLRRGDEVRFKVSQEKASGRKRAVEVVLVRTNKQKREEEQLKKLIDSGATKQQGVVKKMTHDYGFLQSLSSAHTIYFNAADVVTSREGERPRVGSQAEFWVVPDRIKNRESFRALEVQILPPGTLVLEEETHRKLRGTVERAPTLPQRQGFREGGGGGGGGMQPGSARFSVPAAPAEASPEGEGAAATATVVVASLNHKELGKSQVPTLEVGDVIEADLWKSKLGAGTTQARNVKLVNFGGERVEGVVKSLRDGGFGFIRPLGGSEDVYFRIHDTCKGLPDLREGSEVVFTQHESERGGEKKRATRVEVYPKGTLKVEVPLANGVSGVVTRDAKGSGQGTITITDGNNLDVPADIRFPKIAARVREFAKSDNNELVFPSGLSAGERNAAHSVAAVEGLRHESRGEEGNRALHLWKPENEEEAASIKEAEEKRAEQRSNAAKERSKNGERSLTVSFTREDTASSKPDKSQDPEKEKAASDKEEPGGEGGQENGAPQKPSKSKLTQDFRTEKGFAGFAAAAQRGDLVTFDVVLNRGNMKRRAANVKVTKRAAPQSNTANTATGGNASGTGGQEDGGGQDRELMGVVSLVQLERHYGFIEVLDMDERVFFHLSEVLPDDVKAPSTSGSGSAADNSSGVVAVSAPEVEGSTANSSGSGKPVIRRGQEVAFRIGQRQGKSLGLRVRKLKPGTLPTEESLPGRFMGVVVVPPRDVGTDKDKEKDAMASAAGMEGVLVMLREESATSVEDGPALVESLPGPPLEQGAAQQQGEASAEESSTREAENEASKAQRMLSLAGIRVASGAQDGASALPNSIAQHHQPPSSASSLMLDPNGVSPAKRRSSRRGWGVTPKGPPRFSVLRFLASMEGDGVTPAAAATAAAATPPALGEGGAAATTSTAGGAVSFGRGDLVEFTVVARRGQRQQSQRVANVSLLAKTGLPCRRGKVQQVDAKAGVAYVELLEDHDQTAGQVAEGQEVDAAATAEPLTEGQEGAPADADGSRVFFLLKEMVGAAGPLRNGDEVDFMLPPPVPWAASQKPKGKNLAGSGHAVGAVRVQDLKSLSSARQRLNINLRDSQKGPQVRMAQGPDGGGFRVGHRASKSLYADKAAVEPATTDETVSEGKPLAAGTAADITVAAKTVASDEDATQTLFSWMFPSQRTPPPAVRAGETSTAIPSAAASASTSAAFIATGTAVDVAAAAGSGVKYGIAAQEKVKNVKSEPKIVDVRQMEEKKANEMTDGDSAEDGEEAMMIPLVDDPEEVEAATFMPPAFHDSGDNALRKWGAGDVVTRTVDATIGGGTFGEGHKKCFVPRDKYIKREVQSLSVTSNHPNIVDIHGVLSTADTTFMIMPLVKTDLSKLIQDGPLKEEEAVLIAAQFLSALEHVHSNRIVHRDLKPANLLLTHDKQVRLADFGFAKVLQDGEDGLTGLCGTKPYLSPEQVNGLRYGFAADLWSAGVVIYEILHGRTAFCPDSSVDLGQVPTDIGTPVEGDIRMRLDPYDELERENIRAGVFEVDSSRVGTTGADFLRKLILLSPTDRMSASTAGEHPWLGGEQAATLRRANVTAITNERREAQEVESKERALLLRSRRRKRVPKPVKLSTPAPAAEGGPA